MKVTDDGTTNPIDQKAMSDIVERLRWRQGVPITPREKITPPDTLCAEAAAEIERLRAALRECSDDLEAMVEHYYKDVKDYPSELRKYEIDIGPVKRARAALDVGLPTAEDVRGLLKEEP